MKVWIEHAKTPINAIGGKALFCRRLADVFRKKCIEVTDDIHESCDVSINVIRLKHTKSKVRILRLDGVWHDTGKDWKEKNQAISASVKKADGVIYQSQFARRMCDKYLGEAKCPVAVIYNGSDPEYYTKIKPATFINKHPFIAFSKWRPHKRLRDIIHSFLLADINDSVLFVAGEPSNCGMSIEELTNLFNHKKIQYIGQVQQGLLATILKGCKGSIHLCWFDACPNSVVEAICAGIPVVSNNVGGTWEIVAPSGGYVCDIDLPYDLLPVNLYSPPAICRQKVADALRLCVDKQPKITSDHVNINNTAEQYLNFIKALL